MMLASSHSRSRIPWNKSFSKSLILLLGALLFGLGSFAQSYVGVITKQASLRNGPGNEFKIISSLKPDAQIFIESLETENDFYNIIDIRTNKEGYVLKSFVKVGKKVKENSGGIFSPNGETQSYNPEINVFNNTNTVMTLKLGSEINSFRPQEKKVLTVSPGIISFRASAPGVTPYIGSDDLKSNQGYSWKFYIVTRRK